MKLMQTDQIGALLAVLKVNPSIHLEKEANTGRFQMLLSEKQWKMSKREQRSGGKWRVRYKEKYIEFRSRHLRFTSHRRM